MPTVSFYTDQSTKLKLGYLAEKDHRSLSNYLTLLINEHWTLKNAGEQQTEEIIGHFEAESSAQAKAQSSEATMTTTTRASA